MYRPIGRDRVMSDEEGKYEVKAIPLDRTYRVDVSADGYGEGQCEIYVASAPNRRIEAETIILPLANLTLSGKVIDLEERPVANVRVYTYGDGQPRCESITDEDGKFTLKGICRGELRIEAGVREDGSMHYGSATAQGGDTDVVVVLTEQSPLPSSLVR